MATRGSKGKKTILEQAELMAEGLAVGMADITKGV